jgi:hypothetical protein
MIKGLQIFQIKLVFIDKLRVNFSFQISKFISIKVYKKLKINTKGLEFLDEAIYKIYLNNF